MTTKNIFIAVLAVIVGVAIYGAYQFPQALLSVGSPAGTSLSTAKIAEQIITTATTTVLSLLNNDVSDRTITSADLLIKGSLSTTTTTTINCATSTAQYSVVPANTNYVLSMAFTNTSANTNMFGTTTGGGTYYATSSPGITGTTTPQGGTPPQVVNPWARNWAAGTYLVCLVTTADSYNAFTSGTTGYFAFPYRGQ